jgi:hypothetical protein
MRCRVLIAALYCATACQAQSVEEVRAFLQKRALFTPAEIARVESGQAFAKLLPAPSPDYIYVFGAVYVKAMPEQYLRYAGDAEFLRKLPQYLALGRFSATPEKDDMRGFELEPDDIKELRSCRPGKCEVQLPDMDAAGFTKGIDWKRSDVAQQVSAKTRQLALDMLQRYQRGGSRALGSFDDEGKPVSIEQHFADLLRAPSIAVDFLPEFQRHLTGYPQVLLPGAESLFYWERVSFGLKPTLRINHSMKYRSRTPTSDVGMIAVKQLWASHYLQSAIDLSLCVRDQRLPPDQPGCYLISMKASKQAGLTGFLGGIMRRVITTKTRSGAEESLAGIKKELEAKPATR